MPWARYIGSFGQPHPPKVIFIKNKNHPVCLSVIGKHALNWLGSCILFISCLFFCFFRPLWTWERLPCVFFFCLLVCLFILFFKQHSLAHNAGSRGRSVSAAHEKACFDLPHSPRAQRSDEMQPNGAFFSAFFFVSLFFNPKRCQTKAGLLKRKHYNRCIITAESSDGAPTRVPPT